VEGEAAQAGVVAVLVDSAVVVVGLEVVVEMGVEVDLAVLEHLASSVEGIVVVQKLVAVVAAARFAVKLVANIVTT